MDFKVVSEFKPTGDQPQAIEKLVKGFQRGNQFETLLGVTGSGKTFTMAHVIEQLQKPTLVLAHNKTLAAQLYSEFKEFFPDNAVEYFVSYYDYYQPEAYVPQMRSTSFATRQPLRWQSEGMSSSFPAFPASTAWETPSTIIAWSSPCAPA